MSTVRLKKLVPESTVAKCCKKSMVLTLKTKSDFHLTFLTTLIKKHETVPLIFMFILGNDMEGVFFRQMLI